MRTASEFTDNSGVRLKPQGVEVLIGEEGLRRFFDGVYEYAKKHGGTIMQLGIDENLFWAMGVDFSAFHRKRMTELVRERKDIKVLAIMRRRYEFYCVRLQSISLDSERVFAPVPFYIYGECLAIMNFQTVPAPTIILHKFPAITHAYRKQFDAMWKLSREPDVSNEMKSSLKSRKK